MDEQSDRYDPKILDSLTNGNLKLRSAVVASFLASLPIQLRGLDTAIDLKDHRMVRFYAHAIKGMAKQVGAKSLRTLTEQLEAAGTNEAAVPELLSLRASIAGEFEDLRRLLDSCQPN